MVPCDVHALGYAVTVITETVFLPGGTPAKAKVIIDVVGVGGRPVTAFRPDGTIVYQLVLTLDDGVWTQDLTPVSDLLPDGVVYRRRVQIGCRDIASDTFTVPDSGGPWQLGDVLADPPGALDPAGLTQLAQELAAHEADDTAHGDPLGVLATHEATTLAAGAHGGMPDAADVGADPAGSAQVVATDLAAHEASPADDVHGVVAHDWGQDGWGPFTPLVMTAHGAQDFAATVNAARGRVTGLNAGDVNHRVAYARQDTNWVDSEIRSLIWGPSPDFDGTNAQQGHIHRVREISPGLWEGIAVWTAVFGGDYGVCNTRAVRFDGATLPQSGGDPATGAGQGMIDRRVAVTARTRFAFGPWFADHSVSPVDRVQHLAAGDTVAVTDVPGFNETTAVNGPVDVHFLRLETTLTGVEGWAAQMPPGRLTPASGQKRWCPHWLASRVVGGDATQAVVEWKRWRPQDAEPDWGHPSVQRRAVTANAAVPAIATGPGLCALWAAHFHTGSWGEWGQAEFRRL